ncbi:hypothetical protein EU537_00365 [Candidatus Thorarchaeota archaeon]|nr:MAG: hypothetical protein EU537_00365 [Candidatus Thorarchaeota archaeon]
MAYADDEEDDFDEEELDLTIYEETTVQLYAHIYLNDYNGSVTDDEGVQANYSITGGTELKIDIEIGNFPFSSNTSKVTLLNFLQEDIASDEDADYKFRLHEEDGEHEIESEDEWEFEDDIVEIFENLDEDGDGEADDVQTISLVEDSTNQTRAFYTWLHKAIIELPNATTNAVDVKVSYFTTGEALLLFLAYPYFDDGTLVHDPSLKLLKESSPITGPTHIFTGVPINILLGVSIIGVIAVIGAAVAIRKR